ncbi:MAG: Creatinine amidohydrolase [candidate division WS2 bacterium]|nr:Creatinine amidohydrolase [Candidatus Psychracetigena formicireducens]
MAGKAKELLELGELTWHEVEKAFKKTKIVILPIGSIEQHGPHLPMNTDLVLGYEMAKQVAKRTGAILLPPISFGQVWSARHFPGVISLKPSTLKEIVKDICQSLARHKVKLIVIISGHRGNLAVLKEAVRELYDDKISTKILFFSYPKIEAMAKGITTSEIWRSGTSGSTWHAGEIETSLMLAVKPESCHMEHAVIEFPQVPAWYDYTAVSWREINKVGSFGNAKAATPEKGHRLLKKSVDYMVEIIQSARNYYGKKKSNSRKG